ncbi:hypothetical protein [Micromonospora tarensis]|uniref:Uncharacterized protein n=1 Tax=Micromonospora tarensis TaxID=2806100 RepID=A0ABS1YJ73_9ACTN|nr:hypothetical protein [Micromonospora tarensis]MBM0277458.1 hypothetical protein [Micromonospora tarensis]
MIQVVHARRAVMLVGADFTADVVGPFQRGGEARRRSGSRAPDRAAAH